MKVVLAFLIAVFLISGCTQNTFISKEETIKIAETHGIGKADGRIYTIAELNYSDEYNKKVWVVTKMFAWNRAAIFGEIYTIDAENGRILYAKRFDNWNDFNNTIQEFHNYDPCENKSIPTWQKDCANWKLP